MGAAHHRFPSRATPIAPEDEFEAALALLRETVDVIVARNDEAVGYVAPLLPRPLPPAVLVGEVPSPLPAAPGDPLASGIVFSPNPFDRRVQVISLAPGGTVADAIDLLNVGPRLKKRIAVFAGDVRIPAVMWDRVRPKPGTALHIRAELHGGGGGGKGKNPLRTILMLAVVLVSAGAGAWATAALGGGFWAGVGGAAVAATISTAGLFLVNALVPPPKLTSKYNFDQQPGNPYAALTGIRNQFAPYAPIPRVLGERRIYPPLAGRPYTEMQGNTQYLRLLLLAGYGPLDISDIRIGTTPISAFAGAQVEIREGWSTDDPVTLYTRLIQEESLSILLEYNAYQVRVTETETTEVSIDITFPNGLASYDANGNRLTRGVTFVVEYSADGVTYSPASWIDGSEEYGTGSLSLINAIDASASTVVRSGRFYVPSAGAWYIRVARQTPAGGSQDVDQAYWTVLRSIKPDAPINIAGVSLIAIRLQATAQLNGAPDTINCIAKSYLPVYDSGAETWSYSLTARRNPAWQFADVHRRRGLTTVLADDKIDLETILDWATDCAATAPNASEPRWTCDLVLDGGSIDSAAKAICAHGRAQQALLGGKYSVIRDIEKTTPVQHISPRNSSNYRGSKAFIDIPHAIKVRFVNPDKNDAWDEVIAYDDGYNEGNAERFETIELPGGRSSTFAWREGRYHLGVLRLRPEEHSVDMDFESLACTKGDLVRFSHDVVSIGLGQGRISDRTVNGSSNITHLTLDEPVDMESGTTYAVRVRHSDGSSSVHTLVTNVGLGNDVVQLATPVAASTGPAIGDHFQYGESTLETAPMLVKAIARSNNFTARLTLIDAQAGVWTADTGTIPAFVSYITHGPSLEAPAAPTITLRSDASVQFTLSDGTVLDRIEVALSAPAAGNVPLQTWEIEYRTTGSNGDWTPVANPPIQTRSVFISPVSQRTTYDVRARTIAATGRPSEWTTVAGHLVTDKRPTPGNPTNFYVYADGPFIVSTWGAVSYQGKLLYEIRCGGTSWETATPIARFAGEYARFQLPVAEAATTLFWLKALTEDEERWSVSPAAASAAQTPIASANIIYDRDFSEEEWPGVRHDLTMIGSGASSYLELDSNDVGVRYLNGDYFAELDLGGALIARTTIQTEHSRVSGVTATIGSFGGVLIGDLGDLTIGGEPTASDQPVVASYIAVDTAPDDLVEGWRLKASTTGVNGTLAADSAGLSAADCWLAQGQSLSVTGTLSWSVATPAEFSLVLDARPNATVTGDFVLAWLSNTGIDWLELAYDHAAGLLTVTDPDGARLELEGPDWDVDDPVRICLAQDTTTRTLYWSSRRDPTVRSATSNHATLGTFAKLRLGGRKTTIGDYDGVTIGSLNGVTIGELESENGRAPLVFGDVEVRDSVIDDDGFTALLMRGPAGYAPFKPLVPADYEYRFAMLWQRLASDSGVGASISIRESYLFADVPDLRDGNTPGLLVAVGPGSTLIPFNRTFYAEPLFFWTWRTGASPARLVIDSISAAGVYVTPYSLATGLAIAANIDWAAFGYGR